MSETQHITIKSFSSKV